MNFGASTQQFLSSDPVGGGSEVQLARSEAAVAIAEQQAATAQAMLEAQAQARTERHDLIKKIAIGAGIILVSLRMFS